MKKKDERAVRRVVVSLLAIGGFALGGCRTHSFLDQQTVPDRAKYGSKALPVSEEPAVKVVQPTPSGIDLPEDEVAGTWTFTVPATVTRVEHKTDAFDEYTLFNGRPGPNDKPFVVITVNKDRGGSAEKDAEYKVASQRDYTMNGNVVHEWTGQTAAGVGFSELLIRRPGTAGETGDVCHVLALARNNDEQKLALSILGSIQYTKAP